MAHEIKLNSIDRLMDRGRSYWWMPYAIFSPIVVFQGIFLVKTGVFSILSAGLLFALGLFLWTFIEYVLHRFPFHKEFRTEAEPNRVNLHLRHHEEPGDKDYVIAPPALGIMLYSIFTVMGTLATWSLAAGSTISAGIVLGYLFYEWVHYSTHHRRLTNPFMLRWKHHHMLHHFRDHDNYFGVTSPLWDKVFGTLPEATPQTKSDTKTKAQPVRG